MEISQLLLGFLCSSALHLESTFLRSLWGGLCELFGTHLQPAGIFFQALCLGFRARVQGEGLVHGVWNKGSEDLENQFGGSEDRENLIWQAALGIHRKCIIQGSN